MAENCDESEEETAKRQRVNGCKDSQQQPHEVHREIDEYEREEQWLVKQRKTWLS